MAKIDDIAAEAGVSSVTVSNILNGRNKENRPSAIKRAEEIRAIAERIGYRPNAAARAVAMGRHGAIAILLSANLHRGHMFRRTLHELACAGAGDQRVTMAALTDEILEDEARLSEALRRFSADGLIISYIFEMPSPLPGLLERFGIPAIWLNTRREVDCVYPEDLGAARSVTERLLELGHRRIAYVDQCPNLHYSSADRLSGYEAAMNAAHLPPMRWLGPALGETDWLSPGNWQSRTLSWFDDTAETPTAAVCYDPGRASALYAAALRKGLRVPEDISIVTFDEAPYDAMGVTIATSLIPAREIGRRAIEELSLKMAEPSVHRPPCPIDYDFELGETLGPPP